MAHMRCGHASRAVIRGELVGVVVILRCAILVCAAIMANGGWV
jgi:hypothetical protein